MSPRRVPGLVLLAALLVGCGVRVDFIRPTGEPLTLHADPRREGALVARQGSTELDEESFYRLTGDHDAARRFTRHHRAGKRDRAIGGVVAGLGIASGFVGSFWAFGGPPGHPEYDAGRFGAGVGLFSAGVAAVVAGFALALSGEVRATDPDARLIEDPARMRKAAESFNRRLARPPEVLP